MRRSLAAASLAALLVIACGRVYVGGTPLVSPPASALVAWQGFPADQHPRPIVWFENGLPVKGFTSNDGKIAALCNRLKPVIPLPNSVPSQAIATWTDGTSVVYTGISVADAFAAMSRSTADTPSPDCASVPPLVITAAHLGTFDFYTDRGTAQMTAWLFAASGANGEFGYPAVAPSAFWNGAMTTHSADSGAAISADGRTLTWSFAGAHDTPGPCGADYKGVVAESSTAVAIALQTYPHAAPNEPVACDLVAEERSVTVTLVSPLGGRVVVDAEGNAATVCRTGHARSC